MSSLAGNIASLTTGKSLIIAEFHTNKVTVWRVRLDSCGTPRVRFESRTWDLLQARERSTRPRWPRTSGPTRATRWCSPVPAAMQRGPSPAGMRIARSPSRGRSTGWRARSAPPPPSMTCSRRPRRAFRCPRRSGTSWCCCVVQGRAVSSSPRSSSSSRGPARRHQDVQRPVRAERRERHRVRNRGTERGASTSSCCP